MPKGKPNARYTGKFKQAVIEEMRKNSLSQNETAAKYTVPRAVIQLRERIYLEEGPEGLYIERRGRRSTGRPTKLDKKVEEDLIAENERLGAENDYRKKREHREKSASDLELRALYNDNNRRSKAKRKGLPPALHRQQALSAA